MLNQVPFVALKLRQPTGDAAADLASLEAISASVLDRGFALAIAFHDATPGTIRTMPPLRAKPLALRAAVTARHSTAQVQALVAAIVSAAATA